MPEIPLILKLKKQQQKEIAIAQDIIMKEVYNVFERAVLHGGTAIWRVYKGNRFSEDIDAYIPKDEKKINTLFENLQKKGCIIYKKKISKNSLFSNIGLQKTSVRFEALFKKPLPKGFLQEYITVDGNAITVYTLLPSQLIKEKVEAYLKRLKIRDLYDIFFLLRYIENKKEISQELKKLMENFKKPIDEKELRALIIEGIIPTTKEMLEYIYREGIK